jgi:hypothetical protein
MHTTYSHAHDTAVCWSELCLSCVNTVSVQPKVIQHINRVTPAQMTVPTGTYLLLTCCDYFQSQLVDCILHGV